MMFGHGQGSIPWALVASMMNACQVLDMGSIPGGCIFAIFVGLGRPYDEEKKNEKRACKLLRKRTLGRVVKAHA